MESITSCHGFGSFSDFINLNCCAAAAAALFPDEDLDRDGNGGDARSGDPCVATDPDGDVAGDKRNKLTGYRGGDPDGDCGDIVGAGDPCVATDTDGDDDGDKCNKLAGYRGGDPDGDGDDDGDKCNKLAGYRGTVSSVFRS